MKKAFFLLLLVIACMPLAGQAQVEIIETIANKDTSAGYGGDNGPAIDAKLWFPEAVCFDKSGNLLIADVANNRVRKIDPAGIITTIAGRDTTGYSGDNGPATDAGLWEPVDVFIDTVGDIYIADGLDNRIRKITVSTGIITTVAGNGITGYSGDNGLAINAELNAPSGLYVNTHKDIFIADYYNDVVRKVDGFTGIITTIAGNGSNGYSGDNGLAINAELDGAQKVCLDNAGNIFFSDQWNNVVRKVDAATGIITTFAGNGTVGYSGDGGPANNAQLNRPAGLFFDKQNNLFLTEFGNGVVRKIDAVTNIISTVAGNNTWGYSGDGGPPLNAQMVPGDAILADNGDIIIADYDNQCIRKVYNPTSVKEPQNVSDIKVYPNPTTGKFTIQTRTNKQYLIDVRNVVGEKIYASVSNGATTEIDLSDQSAGVYFVYLQSGDERVVRKVVVE